MADSESDNKATNAVYGDPISDAEWHNRHTKAAKLALEEQEQMQQARKPTQAGIADRNVQGANHACKGMCTLQSCDDWRKYALSIGRVTEVAPGEYQSEIDLAYDAFDIYVMRTVAAILARGRKVYGDDAWRARTPRHHINHAIAHLFDHLDGLSAEEDHLGNAICRVMFAYGVYKVTNNNDAADPEKHGRNGVRPI